MKIHGINSEKELPKNNYVDSWKIKNPNAEIKIWSFDEAKTCLSADMLTVYNTVPYLIQQVNILRIAILQKSGGIYLDLDVECINSLDSLENVELIFASIGKHYTNSVIGGQINHSFWQILLDKIKQTDQKLKNSVHGIVSSGSGLLHEIIIAEKLENFVQSSKVFMPRKTKTYPETLTIHHAQGSWIKKLKI
jgi:mannosyltransferase OCH1-like enzyme